MRFQSSRLALMAAAVLTLSAGAVAVAQETSSPRPPPMEEGPDGPGGPPPMHRHHFNPAAHAQHLRDVLQLRPDQDGALKAYLEASAPKAWDKDRDHKPGERPGERPGQGPREALTTPERLDREAAHLARATEAFKAHAAATKAFYAALSPSQQKAFDAMGPMGGGRGPWMHRAEFRHGKGGPDGAPPMGGKRKAS